MSIVRKYRLFKFGVMPNTEFKKVFEFVDSTISKLKKFNTPKMPNCDFYLDKNETIIFAYYPATEHLCIRQNGFLEIVDNLNHTEKQESFGAGLPNVDFIVEALKRVYPLKVETIEETNMGFVSPNK